MSLRLTFFDDLVRANHRINNRVGSGTHRAFLNRCRWKDLKFRKVPRARVRPGDIRTSARTADTYMHHPVRACRTSRPRSARAGASSPTACSRCSEPPEGCRSGSRKNQAQQWAVVKQENLEVAKCLRLQRLDATQEYLVGIHSLIVNDDDREQRHLASDERPEIYIAILSIKR